MNSQFNPLNISTFPSLSLSWPSSSLNTPSQNPQNSNNSSFFNDLSEEMTLSYKKRLIGFVTTLCLGVFFLFLASITVVKPIKFAKFYCFGSLFLMSSTFFLVGPTRQLNNLTSGPRLTATLIYFVSLFLTLYSALKLRMTGLTAILVVGQVFSVVWYGLSYIPYGQKMFLGCCSGCGQAVGMCV